MLQQLAGSLLLQLGVLTHGKFQAVRRRLGGVAVQQKQLEQLGGGALSSLNLDVVLRVDHVAHP